MRDVSIITAVERLKETLGEEGWKEGEGEREREKVQVSTLKKQQYYYLELCIHVLSSYTSLLTYSSVNHVIVRDRHMFTVNRQKLKVNKTFGQYLCPT